MSGHSVIEFECYSCLHRISVSATDSGKQIECPQCFTPQPVPSRTLDLALFDDIFQPVGDEAKGDEAKGDEAKSRDEDLGAGQILNALESEISESSSVPPKPEPPKSESNQAESSDSLPVEEIEPTATDSIFGFNCHICETRLHVQPAQVGTKVECPTCFTKLLVPPPKKSAIPDLKWGKSDTKQQPKFRSPVFNTDELKLSEPIDRPPINVPVDPSFGLEPVTADLLAPLPSSLPLTPNDHNTDDSEIPMLEVLDDAEAANLSRRQRYDAAQQRQIELESVSSRGKGGARKNGTSSSSPRPTFKRKENSDQKIRASEKANDHADGDFTSAPESFDFATLTNSVSVMLRSPGMAWRASVSGFLMGVGWAIMHAITANYHAVHKDSAAQIGEWVISLLVWFLFGGIPYLIGTLLLWFICGYVYRESAQGKIQVAKWETGGASEISSTFLIFAFGYFIAGLPIAFVSFLIVPFRFLFAPPLLISAWFNRSPFAIVAVDAFQNVAQDWRQWKSFYLYLLALSGVALVGGSLMMTSIFILSAITSLLGAAILVIVTIAFASVTGWQCNLIMKRLSQ